ncbi:MAG: sugar phosphate isomerase/epimerase [Saprospiraceae bacterium]|nr:sugar phosphate isomerase/epimerase [Saprospiraceae bacterium]
MKKNRIINMKYIKNVSYMLLLTVFAFACKSNTTGQEAVEEGPIKISLAQWSFNKEIKSGEMNNQEFIRKAAEMGFGGVEYVNQFFKDKADDFIFLDSLDAVAEEVGVEQLLIMIDGEGSLADPDQLVRADAVENHKKWVRAASYLGCHSIRVNLNGSGTKEEMRDYAVEGLIDIGEYAAEQGVNIIVENHGGYSSNGAWLADVIYRVKMENVGTLPDFGNFCEERESGKCTKEYDKYQGVKELLPYAKAVSAKSHDFDENGNETTIDFERMISLVKDAGFHGYIGVEYEGNDISAEEGIKLTKQLIEKHLN